MTLMLLLLLDKAGLFYIGGFGIQLSICLEWSILMEMDLEHQSALVCGIVYVFSKIFI